MQYSGVGGAASIQHRFLFNPPKTNRFNKKNNRFNKKPLYLPTLYGIYTLYTTRQKKRFKTNPLMHARLVWTLTVLSNRQTLHTATAYQSTTLPRLVLPPSPAPPGSLSLSHSCFLLVTLKSAIAGGLQTVSHPATISSCVPLPGTPGSLSHTYNTDKEFRVPLHIHSESNTRF
ncbi:hypothetical protein D1007_16595 [Hordeum vulgare]|nr:hypothetical protein D1007_16595 [Hordeum vulgare]